MSETKTFEEIYKELQPQQEVMSGMAIVGLALSVVDDVLDMFPDYDQRKIKHYYNLRKEYEIELNKPRENSMDGRSTDRVLNLRDECLRYGQTIVKHIQSKQRQE